MTVNVALTSAERPVASKCRRFPLYRWNWRTWLLASSLAFGAWSVGANVWYWFGPQAWTGRLACRQPIIDLGATYQGQVLDRVFPLENTGAREVKIVKVIPTCNCIIPRLDGIAIPPGHQVAFPLQLNVGDRLGPFRKNVIIESNSMRDRHLVLSIRGKVLAKPEVPQ
jgi:hypothetical protein